MRKFLLLFLIFVLGQSAYAFDIVYPKKKTVTINSPTTFFIGASNSPVTINSTPVQLHKTGAFAHFVNLKEGVNTFEFKSDNQIEVYTVTRNVSKNTSAPSQFKKYEKTLAFVTKSDKVPLRSTPVNAGMNRISHLQKGILLNVDGEKGIFYRVDLGNEKKAWVDKRNIEQTEMFTPANVSGKSYNTTDDYYIFTFSADKKVPFEIIEGEDIKLNFFNTMNNFSFEFPYSATSKTDKIVGYSGEYVGNDFIFKIRKFPKIDRNKPLKNIKIIVDPGHGGSENGAIGCFGDKEKNIVLKISKYLERDLHSKGAKVFMTRTSDETVSLNDRVNFANQQDAMIFVSIHNNALPDTLNPNLHKGTSVYYYHNQAKPLAESVLNSMVNNLGTNNDGLKQASFAVIRNSNALSILVEVAYLINPDDNEKLLNTNFQKQCAKAIADGIENYFK